MLDEVARRRLVGVAVVFAAAFLLSIILPTPNGGSDPADVAVVVPLREPPVVAPLAMPTPEASVTESTSTAAPDSAARDTTAPSVPPPATPQLAPRPATSSRPAPAEPAPASPPPASGEWWVQAAAYREERIAQHAVGRLRDMNVPAVLQRGDLAGQPIWRLRAGPFANEAAAETARRKLEGEGFVGARVAGP